MLHVAGEHSYAMHAICSGIVAEAAEALWNTSSINICCNLHWLPVSHHITDNLCLITWKTLHTAQTTYLSELTAHYFPSGSLRSSNINLLPRPSGITSNFSSQAFSVSAPSTWNSLYVHIHSIDKVSTFKRQLKSISSNMLCC